MWKYKQTIKFKQIQANERRSKQKETDVSKCKKIHAHTSKDKKMPTNANKYQRT